MYAHSALFLAYLQSGRTDLFQTIAMGVVWGLALGIMILVATILFRSEFRGRFEKLKDFRLFKSRSTSVSPDIEEEEEMAPPSAPSSTSDREA